ncbi:MAG: Hypoxanthine/guanine phosphoribosyltransferase [Candidatus Woesearchaeota archaeon]|nr:Hypoxanthine/guanine phosphoribosyltransferase [Candidatus Woesearchaeota archaeon]
MDLSKKTRIIPDFPKKGIMFEDISPILQDPDSFEHVIFKMVDYYKDKKVDVIASAESRGFIFGAPLALKLGASFVLLRKPGKLPYKTIRHDFEKEYGTDGFEIHTDAIKQGDSVLIVDDLLATGGTSQAAIKLVEKLGGNVLSLAFLIELGYLNGKEKLKGYDIFRLINRE